MDQRSPIPNPDAGRPLRVWVPTLATAAVWFIAIGLFLYFFDSIRGIILGVLAAAAVAAMLRPAVLHAWGPHWLRAVYVWLGFVIVAGGLIALMSWLVARPIAHELQDWPQVKQDLNAMFLRWAETMGWDTAPTVDSLIEQASRFIVSSPGGTQIISQTTSITAGIVIATAFLFFGSLYMLLAPPGELTRPIVQLVPPGKRRNMQGVFDDLDPKLRWWALGALISIVFVGLISWAGYEIAGVRFAASLALMMGLSEIVPTVGPFTAFVITLLLALAQGPFQAAGVSFVYLFVHLVESYFLHPYVMKKAVKMPPVVTLFTVVFWGKVFGIAGLLLAIPINLVIWAVIDHFVMRRDEQN